MNRTEQHRFTWCRLEERYLPVSRCILCRTPCSASEAHNYPEVIDNLLDAGKIKEYFVMKAKKSSPKSDKSDPVSIPRQPDILFLLEDGKLKPFSSDEYSSSILYQAVDTFAVERRFVKPEEKQGVLYEGRKPGKKTVPILILKEGGEAVLSSWEEIDRRPEMLAAVLEVIAAKPVKQVFVLKRRQ